MNTLLLADLEKTMKRWLDGNMEMDGFPVAYFPNDLAESMARSAAIVLDINASAQKCYEEKHED